MKYVFAGDRDISVWVLEYLVEQGFKPEALLVSEKERASHAKHLIELSGLPESKIIEGDNFKKEENQSILRKINPDYIFGIHFPYLIPKSVLDIPKIGFLNLHPAYLPFNRGWHTPSWAILDQTPIGATLHIMEEKLDTGDVIHQKEVKINPDDTANSLYQRLKVVEFETFKEAFPKLLNDNFQSKAQDLGTGTSHVKNDLFQEEVQKIDLEKSYTGKEWIDKMRALTTNDSSEAAYFIKDDVKYRVQIKIEKDRGGSDNR